MSYVVDKDACKDARGIFEYVSKHLLRQGCKSMNQDFMDSPGCRYRGVYNAMCAVGCLIDDSSYHEDIEGFSLTCFEAPTIGIILKSVSTSLNRELTFDDSVTLAWLQHLHDQKDNYQWEQMLTQQAELMGWV